MHDQDDIFDSDIISKSALKREKQALQDLGKRLLELPDSHFARLPLSEEMREAMALYKRLKKHEARRRQLQYIGKHMDKEPLDEIRAVLADIDGEARRFREHFHRLEQLRDRLLSEGDDAVTAIIESYPALDVQHLRNLLRQARREKSGNKPPAAARKLFRYLRDMGVEG